VQLAFSNGHDRLALNSSLFGVIPEISFIFRHPLHEGRLAPFELGQFIAVKIFLETSVYTFASKVVGISKYPHPHIHLEYPDRINSSRLRAARRTPLTFQATVSVSFEDSLLHGTIIDLSTAGMSFVSIYDIGEVGKPVRLAFALSLDGKDHGLDLAGTIRNARSNRNQMIFRYGVRFEEVADGQRQLLERWLFSVS
jgi:c-di-GMP-binding flagellar brake protein YcgR